VDSDPFTLGRQPPCDLVFDGAAYPTVAPRHCEIVQAGAGYTLRDGSRTGTLLNERPVPRSAPLQPGDVIRLGPGGPLLRFLGQPAFLSPLAPVGERGRG
jgi:pSer/pThr/pTyr-binding forkhead associated (FHA) protein